MSYKKCLQYDGIDVSEGIDINKTNQKSVCFIIIGILNKLVINSNHIFVILVMLRQ